MERKFQNVTPTTVLRFSNQLSFLEVLTSVPHKIDWGLDFLTKVIEDYILHFS